MSVVDLKPFDAVTPLMTYYMVWACVAMFIIAAILTHGRKPKA